MIDDARDASRTAIHAQPDELVFTSGGTESVALAIWGGVRAIRELGTRIVIGAAEHPPSGGVCHVLESDGFEVVMVPVDADGRLDMDRYAAEVRKPGHAPRQRPAREPGAGHAPAGGRGRPARAGVPRPVPHRRLPDGRAAAGRRRGARRRPALAVGSQVRRAPGRRRALRPTRGGRDRVPVRRRSRTQATVRYGEHAGDRVDGSRAHRVARRHGRSRRTRLDAHRPAPRADRRRRCPARASTVIRLTERRTSSASASTGSTRRR